MKRILIYGGTFDPPHNGHLFTAINVEKNFKFDKIIFLPCKTPVLKNIAEASPSERLDLLKLTLLNRHKFHIDERELRRDSPSYMVETLESFRAELGYDVSITLLLGQDAFKDFNQWYRWEEIINLANLLVIHRPYTSFNFPNISSFVLRHKTKNKEMLYKKSCGVLFFYNAGLYAISSSEIRERVNDLVFLEQNLPHSVFMYIVDNRLYGSSLVGIPSP